MSWRREPGDISDLGDEHGSDGASDPVDRLHRPVARVMTKMIVDLTLEPHDLAVVDLDQLATRIR
jgi:hypothetical protein